MEERESIFTRMNTVEKGVKELRKDIDSLDHLENKVKINEWKISAGANSVERTNRKVWCVAGAVIAVGVFTLFNTACIYNLSKRK